MPSFERDRETTIGSLMTIDSGLFTQKKEQLVTWREQNEVKDIAVVLHEMGHIFHPKGTVHEQEIQASRWALDRIHSLGKDIYEEALEYLAKCLESYVEYFPEELQPRLNYNLNFEKYCRRVLDVRCKN